MINTIIIIGAVVLLICFALCIFEIIVSARADKADKIEWRKYLIQRRGRP